jgi:hypothetical protein
VLSLRLVASEKSGPERPGHPSGGQRALLASWEGSWEIADGDFT